MSNVARSRGGTVLSIRVSDDDLALLDAARQGLRPLGLDLSRHATVRMALRRGLMAMSEDFIRTGSNNHK